MESYLAQIMDGVMNFVNDPVRTRAKPQSPIFPYLWRVCDHGKWFCLLKFYKDSLLLLRA